MNVEIAGRRIGTGSPCYVVAEIGINAVNVLTAFAGG